MKSPDSKNWQLAAQEEFKSLLENNTWSLVDLPPGCRAIDGKWIFCRKYAPDGSVDRFKARFVARGFRQQPRVDYIEHELFSLVVRVQTIRYLMALVAELDWELKHMDVVIAFLNGDLQETVYVTQPEGFEDKQHPYRVYKLNKALYGLKQSPKSWYDKIDQFLREWLSTYRVRF